MRQFLRKLFPSKICFAFGERFQKEKFSFQIEIFNDVDGDDDDVDDKNVVEFAMKR